MSTNTSVLNATSDSQKPKRRRLRGACDECRVRKTKCDSAEKPGNTCTNCIIADIQCTHDLPREYKKAELKQTAAATIEKLEVRIKVLEDYICKVMHPGCNIDEIISSAPRQQPQVHHMPFDTHSAIGLLNSPRLAYPMTPSVSANVLGTPLTDVDLEESDAEDLAHVALAEDLQKLSTTATNDRFFGQASTFMFAKHVATVKGEINGDPGITAPDPRRYRRQTYWEMRPWELSFVTSAETSYIYPDDDLLRTLVSLYFEKTNSLIPILHRPTFMKSLLLGQHLWDPSFGMTVLLVCAIGSIYSQDPRVLLPNDTSGLSSGWHYFCQVPVHRKVMLYKSSVYDLQYYCLAALYFLGTSMPHAAWNVVGIGLRYALEKGVHRRKGQTGNPSAEHELQKRAFWSLVCLDRLSSSHDGRPCAFSHETFDVGYPIECDDEYWVTGDPQTAFRQPAGKPCSITSFVYFIKLCEILGFALRTLYTNKKSKILSGFIGKEWEGRTVAALDSSMNRWKDSLPQYLQWDPERQDPLFFHQSVELHATYFYVQMQIHRPFLIKKSSLTFSSLAMCTSAARSCCHILETATTRGLRVLPPTLAVAFTAGMVIALSLLGSQSLEYNGNRKTDTENLQKCINVLKACENRWHCAGRLGDILNEASAIHEYQPSASRHRRQSFFTEGPVQLASVPPAEDVQHLNASSPSPLHTLPLVPISDWDIQSMLLAEMGVVPDNTMHNLESGAGLVNGSRYPLHSSSSNDAESPYSLPLGTDTFSLWTDFPMASSSIEEWDAYLASLGHS